MQLFSKTVDVKEKLIELLDSQIWSTFDGVFLHQLHEFLVLYHPISHI
jgi:hypothetical protein